MTGQMPDIIEKISAARDTFFRINGFMPNTIKMSMADYRATLELGDPSINVGMRIVKRAGEMECAFDEAAVSSAKTIDGTCVHGNDFMTCAKCIPPITKREFPDLPDTIKISMGNGAVLAGSPEIGFYDALNMEGAIGDYARSIAARLMSQITIP